MAYFLWKWLVVWPMMHILYPCKVIGKKNLVKKSKKVKKQKTIGDDAASNENTEKTGAVIYAPNHEHNLDVLYLMAYTKRPFIAVGKEEIGKNAFFNFFVKTTKWILVNREKPSLDFFRKCNKVLKDEKVLTLFPEGTRVDHSINKTIDVKDGVSFFAIKNNAYVQPIGILKRAKKFKRNYIIIGEPFKIELGDLTQKQAQEEGNKRIATEIEKLLNTYTGGKILKQK